jgi:hypothetical protein
MQHVKVAVYVDSVSLYKDTLIKAFGDNLAALLRDVWHAVELLRQALKPGHAMLDQCITELWSVLLYPDEEDMKQLRAVLQREPTRKEISKHVKRHIRQPDQLVPALQDWGDTWSASTVKDVKTGYPLFTKEAEGVFQRIMDSARAGELSGKRQHAVA